MDSQNATRRTKLRGMGQPYTIDVAVAARHLDDRSEPGQDRYVLACTIRRADNGREPAHQLTRHRIVADARARAGQPGGEGVAGEHPCLRPGEGLASSSGTVPRTDPDTLRGRHRTLADDGTRLQAPLPAFTLTVPRTLR